MLTADLPTDSTVVMLDIFVLRYFPTLYTHSTLYNTYAL